MEERKGDKIDQLYNAMVQDGMSVDKELFRSKMLAPGAEGYHNRKDFFDAMKADGDLEGVESYEDFASLLGLHEVKPDTSKQTSTNLQDKQHIAPSVPAEVSDTTRVANWQKDMGKSFSNVSNDALTAQAFKQFAHQKQKEDVRDYYEESVKKAKKRAETNLNKASNAIEKEAHSIPMASFAPGTGGMTMGQMQSISKRNSNDKEYQTIQATKYVLDDTESILRESQKHGKTSFLSGAARGFMDKTLDMRTWTFGSKDLDHALALRDALNAQKNGNATDAQKGLLDAVAKKIAVSAEFGDDLGLGYKAGQVTAESLPFMIEMVINPASGIGQVVSKGAAKAVINKVGKEAVKRNMKKYVAGKAATRVLGDVAGGAVMAATTGASQTASDVINRMNGQITPIFNKDNGEVEYGGVEGQENLGSALKKGFVSSTIERQSEFVGNYLRPISQYTGKLSSKILDRFGLGKVNKFLKDVKSTNFAKTVEDFEKHTQWNGTLGEYAEEIIGGIENAIFVGDQTLDTNKDTGVFNLEKNVETFLGVSLLGGAISTVKTVGYRTPSHRLRRELDIISQNVSPTFDNSNLTESDWDIIRDGLDSENPAEARETLISVLSDETYSENQRRAIAEYAKKSQMLRGAIMREESLRENRDPESIEDFVIDAYENGYNSSRAEEWRAARQEFDAANLDLIDNPDLKRDLDRAIDFGELDSVLDGLDPEQKSIAETYIHARSQYDGVIENIQDNIELMVMRNDAQIDKRTNLKDGMIHGIVISDQNAVEGKRFVYLVDGNVEVDEYGHLKPSTSRTDLPTVFDTVSNKKEMISADRILAVGDIEDPNIIKQYTGEQIRQQAAADAASKIDQEEGNARYSQGNRIVLSNGTQTTEATITSEDDGQGYMVETDSPFAIDGEASGNTVHRYTQEQLDNMVVTPQQNEEEPVSSEAEENTSSETEEPVSSETEENTSSETEEPVSSEAEETNQQETSEQSEPKAIDQIPYDEVTDKDGNTHKVHRFEDVSPETTYDALLEQYKQNEERMAKKIDNRISKLDKEIKATQKQLDKLDESDDFDADIDNESQYDELDNRIKSLKQSKEYWERVKRVPSSRNITSQVQSEEEVKAAKEEKAEKPSDAEGTQGNVAEEVELTDRQGNPINEDGSLKLESVTSIDEITDEDFMNPTRSIKLPKVSEGLNKVIGADNKPLIIKKNIFTKNNTHHHFTPKSSRAILKAALYDTEIVGQTQPISRPNYWLAIKIDEESPIVVLEVNRNNENIEIVGWYTLDERNLKRIQRQAKREDGELLILTSSKDAAASLSTLPSNLTSVSKASKVTGNEQGASAKDSKNSIVAAETEVDTEPAETQKEAGNYKIGHVKVASETKQEDTTKPIETQPIVSNGSVFKNNMSGGTAVAEVVGSQVDKNGNREYLVRYATNIDDLKAKLVLGENMVSEKDLKEMLDGGSLTPFEDKSKPESKEEGKPAANDAEAEEPIVEKSSQPEEQPTNNPLANAYIKGDKEQIKKEEQALIDHVSQLGFKDESDIQNAFDELENAMSALDPESAQYEPIRKALQFAHDALKARVDALKEAFNQMEAYGAAVSSGDKGKADAAKAELKKYSDGLKDDSIRKELLDTIKDELKNAEKGSQLYEDIKYAEDLLSGKAKKETNKPTKNEKRTDFGYRVPVENSKFPKNVPEDFMVKKVRKSAKRVDGETITVALIGNDLYIKRAKGKYKSGMEARIPNATQYSASEIALRIDLGIGTSTDAARMISDAIMELYHNKGLKISSSISHLRNVRFSIGTDISRNQSPAEQLATQAVLTALDNANVPVVIVTEDEIKSLKTSQSLTKIQKKMLDGIFSAAKTIRGWISNGKRGKTFKLSLPQTTLDKIKKVTGRDFESHNITANSIAHLLRNHGVNGNKLTTTSIPLRKQDAELIPYIMVSPDRIEMGTEDVSGRESIRFYKNLSNGYVVVVEKEYKNSPDDMETITMWAERSFKATNAQSETAPDTHVLNAILDTDTAKIKKDAENAIAGNVKDSKSKQVSLIMSDGTVYGAAYNGKIYLNQDFINPNTPIHEYTHLWAKAMMLHNPQGWQSIKDLLKGTPVWNEVLNDSQYEDIRDNEDEVASEALSRISGKENAARMEAEAKKILEESKGIFDKAEAISLIQRMKDALRKFWNWVGTELFHIKNFKSIEEVTDRVLFDLTNGTDLGSTSDGKARFHFIGEKGAYSLDQAEEGKHRLENLDTARKMEHSGEDALNIKMATGWERGADGKWRYEIHDFDAFNHVGNLEWMSRHPEIGRYKELNVKNNSAILLGKEPLTEDEQKELEELKGKVKHYDPSKLQKNIDNLKLTDFVQDEELFSAYPNLKQTVIGFAELGDVQAQVRVPQDGVYIIDINKKLYEDANGMSVAARKSMESALVHEVQHIIQREEGFARGSNERYFEQKRKYEGPTTFDKFVYDFNQFVSKTDAPYSVIGELLNDENYEDFRNSLDQKGLEELKSIYKSMDKDVFMSNYNSSVDTAREDLLSPYTKYHRTSGEVEARNVQSRMEMDMDERRKTLAEKTEDVARKDQIFIEDSLVSYDMASPQDSPERKTLVGVHNISEDKLRKALKLGGLANPSVAIIDSSHQQHNEFGNISLILPSSSINGERTYTGDAWTPTYPKIIRQISNQGHKKIAQRIDASVENRKLFSAILGDFEQFLESGTEHSLEYLFLKEKGYEPKVLKSQGLDISRKYFLDKFGLEDTGYDYWASYQKALEAPDEVWIEFNKWRYAHGNKQSYDYQTRKIQYRLDKYGDTDENKAFIMEPYLVKDFSSFDTFMNKMRIAELRKDDIDVTATLENAQNEVVEKMLGSEFDEWLDKLIEESEAEEVFFDGFTPSGRPRYKKATLENISKKMKAEGKKNVYNSTGLGATHAMILKQMKSLEDIKSRKSLLKTDEQFKEAYDALHDELVSLSRELAERQNMPGNIFLALDAANHRIQESLIEKNPIAYLNQQYGLSIEENSDLAKRIKQFKRNLMAMPSKYFETKFEHPVMFNEFSAAVVPSTTSEDIKQALKDNGLKVVEYDEKDKESRKAAFDEAIHLDEDILFRSEEDVTEPFYSNAEHAVKSISQKKATPEQWLKMIQKNGGLKAGEDKWLGLSDWLNASEAKTLTKDEVLDYIRENEIQIEEVKYEEGRNIGYEAERKIMQKYGEDIFDAFIADSDEIFISDTPKAIEIFNRFTDVPIPSNLNSLSNEDSKRLERFETQISSEYKKIHDSIPMISPTRMDYTTKGLNNKKEIVLVAPNVDPFQADDSIHFGTDTGGRAVAWIRFGETTDANGKRVLVIDEIQSNRHQEGRKSGYRPKNYEAEKSKLDKAVSEASRALYDYIGELVNKYHVDYELERVKKSRGLFSEADKSKFDELLENYENALSQANQYTETHRESISAAPFEKNWAEVCFKRMLRYAAENGYDKVAWTTGMQQAMRYNIGEVLDLATVGIRNGERKVKLYQPNAAGASIVTLNENGEIKKATSFLENATGQHLSDVVGKELSNEIMNAEDGARIEIKDTLLGGEGMKSFYDQMLPSFVNKYVKKWGTKVGEVTMPMLNPNDQVMHSVDVTDEMKESVMQGQPLFRAVENTNEIEWLENQPHKTAYRAMQVIDGKLYSPMASGKSKDLGSGYGLQTWDKATELDFDMSDDLLSQVDDLNNSDREGNVVVIPGVLRFHKGSKGGKATLQYHLVTDETDVWAAYNPYQHNSDSMLNDQFKAAWRRGNLVVVEAEVPVDDLNSEYHAKYAKDSVGETEWKSGDVASQFPKEMKRNVFLSRYTKPVRILSNSEVAQWIGERVRMAEKISGKPITLYEASFHPEVKKLMEADGFEFVPVEQPKGNVSKILKGHRDYMDDEKIAEVNDNLSGNNSWMRPNEAFRDGESYEQGSDDAIVYENDPATKFMGYQWRTPKQRKDFADRERKRMMRQAEELCEKLHLSNVKFVHKADLQGKKARAKGFFNTSTGEITIVVDNHNGAQDMQRSILHEAVAHYGLRKLFGSQFGTFLDNVYNVADADIREAIDSSMRKNGWGRHEATEEYLAHLAEDTDFETEHASFWRKLKECFMEILHNIGFKDFKATTLTDNELRYILWRSYQDLAHPGYLKSIFGKAEDTIKQYEWKVGNYQNGNLANTAAEATLARETYGGNSGYVGYSMSKRAAEAREEGRYPKTDFKKVYGITQKSFDAMAHLGLIEDREWHHTSMYGNRTTFYGWNYETLSDTYQKHKKEIDSISRKLGDKPARPYTSADFLLKSLDSAYYYDHAKLSDKDMEEKEERNREISMSDMPREERIQAHKAVDMEFQERLNKKYPYDEIVSEYHNTEEYKQKAKEILDAEDAWNKWESGIKEINEIFEQNDPSLEAERIVTEAKANGTYMKAPNGKPTNLSERQWRQVRTKAFKNWFGDWENDPENASKVVDENGEPRVVYHGTPHYGFSKFDKDKIGERDHGYFGEGFYFTPSKLYASSYTRPGMWNDAGQDSKVYQVFLNIKQPKKWSARSGELDHRDLWIDNYGKERNDGVLVFNDRYNVNWDNVMNLYEVVAFSPNQIKSATDNNGGFDPNNEDILFRAEEDKVPKDVRELEDVARGLASEYDKRIDKASFTVRESAQDSMLGLKTIMDVISKATGKQKIEDWENPYMAENRMSSMNRAEMTEYRRKYYKPMVDAIHELLKANKGLSQSDISDYVMIKHEIERQIEMSVKQICVDKEGNFDAGKYSEWRKACKDLDDNTLSWDAQIQKRITLASEFGVDVFEKDYAGLTGTFEEEIEESEDKERVHDAFEAARIFTSDFEANNDVDKLNDAIREATRASLDKLRTSGLISKETFDNFMGTYEYYVPLRGFDETTAEEVYAYLEDNSVSSYNNPVKKAKGRKSKADDPFPYIVSMADSAIVQGNRNLMKQAFLNFVLNRPNDLVTVNPMWITKDPVTDTWVAAVPEIPEGSTPERIKEIVDSFNAIMQEKLDAGDKNVKKISSRSDIPYRVIRNQLSEHQIIVSRNGKRIVMTINGDPRAALAINGHTNPDASENDVVKFAASVNRWLSSVYTTKNPDFVVSNFTRDAVYSNSMVWVKESPSYAVQFNKNFMKYSPQRMMSLFHKFNHGKLNMKDDVERNFYTFMMNGGETGYSNVYDIEELKKILKKDIDPSLWHETMLLLDKFDTVNRAIENCARFSAYMASREDGRSVERSVWDAKEISVNFNKKGAGATMYGKNGKNWKTFPGLFMGAMGASRGLYVFFNAGIQGMNNILTTARKNPKKFTALATVAFTLGYIIPMVLSYGDDDDDDKDLRNRKHGYYDIPSYVRRSNFMLPFTGDSYISIPLPIEFRTMYGMGELAYSYMSGREKLTPSELAREMAGQISQAFPIDFLEGNGDSPLAALIPSSISPIAQVLMNEDWTGMPIYKDFDYNKNLPEWQKAYAKTNKTLVGLSKDVNRLSGGNDYKKGAVDNLFTNPAVIEHLLEGYLGGSFTFANKMLNSVNMARGEMPFDWRNVPIANRLLKTSDERTKMRAINNEYFKKLGKFGEINQQLSGFKKDLLNVNISDEDRNESLKEYERLMNSEDFQKSQVFKVYKSQIDKLRDMQRMYPLDKNIEYDKLYLEAEASEIFD